jgi:hypothetical protein
MTPGQADEVTRRNGSDYTIEGTHWHVSLNFVNHNLEDKSSGNVYEIELRARDHTIKPCDPAMLVSAMESRYGPFQIYPGLPQDLPGRRPLAQPYAVKQIGSVTITLNFLQIYSQRNGDLECLDPTITYFKAGLAKIPESKPLPRGQF